MMECTPLVYRGRPIRMECLRPGSGGGAEDYRIQIKNVADGAILAELAQGYGLASAISVDDRIFVYASRAIFTPGRPGNGWNDVTVFWSDDLRTWNQQVAVPHAPEETILNTSVCPSPDGYVMACEITHPAYVPFTITFARSANLLDWSRVPDAVFAPDRYAACPCLRYSNGFYQMLYLEHRPDPRRFETYLARSSDLKQWDLSPRNPILAADGDEGCNNSDPDLVEYDGKVYLYYATGDQLTWGNLQRAVFHGSLSEFYRWAFG